MLMMTTTFTMFMLMHVFVHTTTFAIFFAMPVTMMMIMTFATILTMVDIYRYDAELQMRFDSRGFTYRK